MAGAASVGTVWSQRAADAHLVLLRDYGNRAASPGRPGLFRLAAPAGLAQLLGTTYWWQAHALDALVDAQLRAPSRAGLRRIRRLPLGLRLAGRPTLVNPYYDDMAWLALALLRAESVGASTRRPVLHLWREIVAGWSDVHGGGIAWSRRQPGYKNVPAGGPAAILSARLYRRDGDPSYLDWAQRIMDWIDATLVDRVTGLVWDGIGRTGDDTIDRDWLFTYTHGVVIGAHAELHAITGDQRHAAMVTRTADAVVAHLAPDGILQDEGADDGALFRGALARYLAPVDHPAGRELLRRSGEAAWACRDAAGRFGPSWRRPPTGPVPLSAHLSGLLLVEQLAALERIGG